MASVAGAFVCVALTIGCAGGAPGAIEHGDATGATKLVAVPPGPSGAANPTPPAGYPYPTLLGGYSGGESVNGGQPAAEAYPGGGQQTRRTPEPAAERTAIRVAALATMGAARDSMSAAIAAVLPAGATFELDELHDWSGALGGGKGLPIRLRDGRLDYVALVAASPNNVAGGSEEPYARLVWRMTETVPVTGVTAIRETGLTWSERDAQGLQVDAGRSTWLVVVAFTKGGTEPEIEIAYSLPGVLAASRESERSQHIVMSWESDASGLLVGSTVRDREDGSVQRRLTVHGAPSGGVAPLVGTFGPDASVQDRSGVGGLEIVAAAGDGSHDVWRLGSDGLVAVEHLAVEEVPVPGLVKLGALPALPADLYLYRPAGGGEVWRWPATGGDLEHIGPMPGVRTERDSELRIALPKSDEATAAGRPPYLVARDEPVVVYALADKQDPAHAVALGFQNVVANTWRVVYITGTLGSWSVAPNGRSALYMGRGALSGVSTSYAADDAGIFLVTPGGAEETRLIARCEPVYPSGIYRSLRCTSFALDATWSNVAYGDGHGVWVVPVDGGVPRRVLEHHLSETEEEIFGTRIYRPESWSPDGNWLALQAGGYEGSSGALLNLQSAGVIGLDAAGQGPVSGSTIDFAPDSTQVGITRYGHFRVSAAVSLFDLASRANHEFLAGAPVTGRYNGAAGVFIADGRFRFGSWSPWRDRYQADGLFELDPQTGVVRRLAKGLASLDPALVSGSYPPDLVWSASAEAFALAGTTSVDEWYAGALVGTEAATYDASDVLGGSGYLQWSRAER